MTCAPVAVPGNGTVEYSTVPVNESGELKYDLQTVVTFDCNVGYFLNGKSERTCMTVSEEGVWSAASPNCEGIHKTITYHYRIVYSLLRNCMFNPGPFTKWIHQLWKLHIYLWNASCLWMR